MRKLGTSDALWQTVPVNFYLPIPYCALPPCCFFPGARKVVFQFGEQQSVVGRALIAEDTLVTKRILVIDDQARLLHLMRMILEDEHYQVSIHQEGKGAFERVKHSLPDLIILDLKLADASGLDVLRALKDDQATADIPVIVYTAAVLEAEEVSQLIHSDQARYHGVRVLQKPFELDALLELVQEVLGAGDPC